MPGLVKIGMTDGLPSDRLIQLSSLTAVPTPFSCAWYAYSPDSDRDERALHNSLKNFRQSASREFFRCSPGFARSAAESIGLQVLDSKHLSTQSHTLGYPNSEWIGAAIFFALFLLTLPVWGSSITWYFKPIVNWIVPVAIGFGVQGYLMLSGDGD